LDGVAGKTPYRSGEGPPVSYFARGGALLKEVRSGPQEATSSGRRPSEGLPVHFSILLAFARKGGDASHHELNRLFAGCLSLDAPLRRSSRTSAVLARWPCCCERTS